MESVLVLVSLTSSQARSPSCDNVRVDESFFGLTRETLTSAGLSLPEISALLLAIKRFKGELGASSPRTVVQRRATRGEAAAVSALCPTAASLVLLGASLPPVHAWLVLDAD